jgi:hypothetical protein
MRRQLCDGLLILRTPNYSLLVRKEKRIYSTFKSTKGEATLCPNSATNSHSLRRPQSLVDELCESGLAGKKQTLLEELYTGIYI